MNRMFRLATLIVCSIFISRAAAGTSLDDLRSQANSMGVNMESPMSTPTNAPSPEKNPICRSMDLRGQSPAAGAEIIASIPAGSKVVMLNEMHFESGFFAHPALLQAIKAANPAVDCLYMEFRPGNESNTEETGKDEGYDPYQDLWHAAHSLGIKIIFVDGANAPPLNQVYANILARNPDMVQRIASSLDHGTCKAGVLIIGKTHNFTVVAGRPIQSMQSLFAERNISTFSINIVDLSCAKTVDGTASPFAYLPPGDKSIVHVENTEDPDYSVCLGRPFAFGTGFINRKNGDFCKVPMETLGSIKWGTLCDFDATLFY